MRMLQPEEATVRLLPGRQDQFAAVLFAHNSDAESVERFQQLQWPAGWDVFFVDVAATPALTGWFGVRETPVLAVIRDGALLALEYECAPEVCERLQRWAVSQHEQIGGQS